MTAANSGERFTTILFYGVVLLLAYLVFRVFEAFLVPLAWAGVLAVFFFPAHTRLERRWGQTPAAALSTLAITLILIVPTLSLMTLFVREGVQAARGIQQSVAEGQMPWVNQTWEWIRRRTPGVGAADLPTMVRQTAERAAEYLVRGSGVVLRNLASFVFDLFVTLFALFYLLRDSNRIVRVLRRALPFDEEHREQMLREARDLTFASVNTSLAIAAVQGLLGGTAFALTGLGAPFFWGVMMAFFSLIPVVGSALIWLPAAIWLVASGSLLRGLLLVAICAGVAGVVDNFLRPLLLSGRAHLNELLVFISVLGGIRVFGMVGLILGPIVVATAAGVLEVYTRQETGPVARVEPPSASGVGGGRKGVLE